MAREATPAALGAMLHEGDRHVPRTYLIEAAADRHRFGELAPHMDDPWLVTLLAQERVVRGEDLRDAAGAAEDIGVPLLLQAWEPWQVARRVGVTVEALAWDLVDRADTGSGAAYGVHGVDGRSSGHAPEWRSFERFVEHWRGRRALRRIRSTDPHVTTGPDAELRAMSPVRGLARLAWAAGHGGRRGPRRPTGAARIELWHLLAECCGLPWPPDPAELAVRLTGLRFWDWTSGGHRDIRQAGRSLSIVIGGPESWFCSVQAFDVPDATPETRLEAVARRLSVAQDWGRLVDLIAEHHAGEAEIWPSLMVRSARSPTHLAALLELACLRRRRPALTGTAAHRFTWDRLGPHLTTPEAAAWFAQERVVRGEDLRGRTGTHAELVGLPLIRLPWEPDYLIADEVPYPNDPPTVHPPRRPAPGEGPPRPVDRQAIAEALAGWSAQSEVADLGDNVAVVDGGPHDALAALNFGGRVHYVPADAGSIAHRLVRAHLNHASHDQACLAAGRWHAWRALAALAGVSWPPDPQALTEAMEMLWWWHWTPPAFWLDDEQGAALPVEDRGPHVDDDSGAVFPAECAGWWLGIAVTDPVAGWSAAMYEWSIDYKIR